jgi:hypothetical protein
MSLRFHHAVPALGLAGLVACATYWPTLTGDSRSSAEDAYRCAREQAGHAGFKPMNWNDREMAFDARRTDTSATGQLPREERQFDVLRVKSKRKGNASSSLSVRAETIVQRFSREGWVSNEVPASAGAKEAARELIRQCS